MEKRKHDRLKRKDMNAPSRRGAPFSRVFQDGGAPKAGSWSAAEDALDGFDLTEGGSLMARLAPCGHFVADGHEVFDPECDACAEANSDAPDWTM